jgi:membrane protein YqaA with SNARE-associated domain
MKTALAWIQNVAVAMGGPGVFIIPFLDSSFLSFPQVTDLLVISMVLKYPLWMPYYAALATLGSIAGCLAIYYVARKGGEALLRRRFHGPTVDRGMRLAQRYGPLTLLVPALLPPPAPFKIFVLLAGVSEMRPLGFTVAIAVGRGIRYFGIGLLTVWYGQSAVTFLATNGRTVAFGLAGLFAVGVLAYVLWRHFRSRGNALTPAGGADIMP